MAAAAPTEDRIRAFLRIRPPADDVAAAELESVYEVSRHRIRTKQGRGGEGFIFQGIFNPEDSTEDVYESLAPTVRGCLEGISATVMAYGQSASGKTHTIVGDHFGRGLVQMALDGLVEHAGEHPEWAVDARVSFFEVHNDRVFDLVPRQEADEAAVGTPPTPTRPGDHAAREASGLKLYDDGDDVLLDGLTWHAIHRAADGTDILRRGLEKRQRKETLLNGHSSRSHAVFQIDLKVCDAAGAVRWARLSLCDLAGSEHAGRAGTQGDTRKEGTHINLSLLALENVIQALASGAPHVPYRNSNLTRILRPSLGGNSRTAIVFCIAPGSRALEESLSTLQFSARASVVCNAVRVNETTGARVVPAEAVQQLLTLWDEDNQCAMQREAALTSRAEHQLRHALSQAARDVNAEGRLWAELDAHSQKRIGELLRRLEQERAARAEEKRKWQRQMEADRKRQAEELGLVKAKIRRLESQRSERPESGGNSTAGPDESAETTQDLMDLDGPAELQAQVDSSRQRLAQLDQELQSYRHTEAEPGGAADGVELGPPTERAPASRPPLAVISEVDPAAVDSSSWRRPPPAAAAAAAPPRVGGAGGGPRSRMVSRSAMPPPRAADALGTPGGGARHRARTPTTPQRALGGTPTGRNGGTPGARAATGTPGGSQRHGNPSRGTPSQTHRAPRAFNTPPARQGGAGRHQYAAPTASSAMRTRRQLGLSEEHAVPQRRMHFGHDGAQAR
eukprot:TRINITY_DN11618_c0_g1_i2.p1 TRINITY_DN11618_c0_g1~~TRINITY_DN11618_c0_g1_i2.p1  ORF type:complete len:736 (+),score=208.02 TRINITY_DN11618_c0_g1_i2:82-2289(+)